MDIKEHNNIILHQVYMSQLSWDQNDWLNQTMDIKYITLYQACGHGLYILQRHSIFGFKKFDWTHFE